MAKKLSISMNEQLLDKLDSYCEENFQSRSGLIALAVKQYFDGLQVIDSMSKMTDMLKELKKLALEQQQPPQE